MKRKASIESEESQLARRSERWAFWALPVATLAILVTVLCTIWTVRRSEEFAKEAAERDKPKAAFYLAGVKLDEPLNIYFAGDFSEKSLTIVELPIAVVNQGDKTLRGLELLLREPALSAVPNDVLEVKSETRLPISVMPERHFVTNGGYSYTSFALPELHPGQAVQLGEPLRAIASQIRQIVDAKTKDGMPLSVDVRVTVGLPVQISIAGEDMQPSDINIEVFGVRAKTEKELFLKFVELEEQDSQQYKRDHGVVSYWLGHLMPVKRKGLLVMPEYQTVLGAKGERVDLAQSPAPSTTVMYSFP